MSKFDHNKIMPRYSIISFVLMFIALFVIGRAAWIMTFKKDYWMKVANRVKRDSVEVQPARGNILSCDGQLLASSLPEFRIYMDFQQLHEAGNDSLWDEKLDSICDGLHTIFPEKSAQAFKTDLKKGQNSRKKRHWPIWPYRINYNTYSEIKMLPVFKLSKLQSGFHEDELNARERPYGTLAGRTVGDMFAAKDEGRTPRCGLELSYDSLLRGTTGIVSRRKVLNKYLNITDTPPINGSDIITTIDVNIQDLAERAIIKKIKEIGGNSGVAIVMDVKTGDIKAIVNMEKCVDGEYREIKNHAVSDLIEPGSVFKIASLMVALEDGVCDTAKTIPTGNGQWHVYGRDMKDSNWRQGGHGTISLGEAMEFSSNIGISYVIDKYYHNDPEKFVRGIYRTGINDPNIRIPIVGHATPKIRMPKRLPNGQWRNWSKTALMWMSIGYETLIPPIYTLAFYNAIANGGCMMQPRFVKAAVMNGDTIAKFPPEVVKGREQIASEKTIKIIHDLLRRVVVKGTGKKANTPNFYICGKTGTAMIARNGSYSGIPNHLLSFAGWFGTKEQPLYSCIVCIQKAGMPAFGWMSAEAFRDIAEGVMAKYVKYDISDARDSASILIPDVKTGNILSADYVLSKLGISTHTNFMSNFSNPKPIWGMAERRKGSVMLRKKNDTDHRYMPNVIGMGARDAVYLIEKRGVKCRLKGRGKVVEQSLEAGHFVRKGQVCVLTLN